MLEAKAIKITPHSFLLPKMVIIFKLKLANRTKILCIEIFICLGHEGIVKLLVENGADINDRNRYNETALIHAATNGDFQIEDCILKF